MAKENINKAESPSKSDRFPLHVLESIRRGLKQYEDGKTISLHEFKEKHFSKKQV
jgi:hypothetical protein